MNPERICYGCFTEKEPGQRCPRCGFDEKEEQPYLALPLGTILNGRYLVGKVLGIGGFGITYLGYDLTLEIKVAIKEYMPSALATRHADRYSVALTGRVEEDYKYGMERFLEEAKILAKLQSTPNIVSVQNYFKENGTAYFVMEYIDGMSLKAYLEKSGGKIPYSQALAFLQPIMAALIQVHGMHLLHRDISPDNIYITAKGESRLLDFGAARFASGDGKSVSVILKHGYAPEEQYSSHGNQGPWTDVYAMGATLYRCITGQLPPDSIARIHSDSIKPPTELGARIPGYVESAIMKALSVKTEDRFANMEGFIRALNSRSSLQNQVAEASKRARATASGKTAYKNPIPQDVAPNQEKPSVVSRLLSYLKANPIIAFVSTGGVLAAIALCVILPIALSGSKKTTPTVSGNTPVIEQPTIGIKPTQAADATVPTTQITEPAAKMEEWELGNLNATIQVPDSYMASTTDLIFIDEQKKRGIMADYYWIIDGPIYDLSDVESQREAVVATMMEKWKVQDYQILTAGPDRVGSADAYQIYFEATDMDGTAMEMVVMAVEGYGCGCYFLIAAYPKGDEAAAAELQTVLRSFSSKGAPNITHQVYYAERAGIKVIADSALAQGGGADMEVEMNVNGVGTVHELFLYPTQADRNAPIGEGCAVEVGKAYEYGLYSPEDVINYNKRVSGTNNETYTFSSGGAEWLAYDFTISNKNFSCASAVIHGECYLVACMFNAANKDTVVSLYNQAIASVRPWNG